MIEVYYVSGTDGTKTLLNQNADINIRKCNPHATNWKYDSIINQYGITISQFKKDPILLELTFKFTGVESVISHNMNNFFETCEKDIINMTPGRLYFDKQYITGFFIDRTTIPASEFYGYEQSTVFLAPYPFYITEKLKRFLPNEKTDPTEAAEYLDYNYDYNYDYSAQTSGVIQWDTKHFTSSKFKMTIYGPCVNPVVYINGYPYQIYDTLETNEYLIITNMNAKTVTKYRANGSTKNIFDLRGKTNSVFQNIPGGVLTVNWNAQFGFDILLYQERSEPKWK